MQISETSTKYASLQIYALKELKHQKGHRCASQKNGQKIFQDWSLAINFVTFFVSDLSYDVPTKKEVR